MFKWCISIGLHAVWLFLFLYLWNSGGIGNLNYDSLSVSLSILQTALVIFAFLGFGFFAIMAERTASSTAGQVATEEARKTAEKVVQTELPAMLKRELQELGDLSQVLGTQSDEAATMPQNAANSLDGDKT